MAKPQAILVLDLGSNYIKLVEADIHGEKTSIKNFSVTPLSPEALKVASINDPLFIDFIKDLISQKAITATNVIMCISHHQMEIKNLTLPFMNSKDLKASIGWEIKDLFSVPTDDSVIDYKVLKEIDTEEGKKIELCVAALPRKAAEEYVAFLNALKLTPLMFLLEPQTAWGVVKNISEFTGKKVVALINMGASKTIMSVFENGKLEIMRSLPISSNKFTSDIAAKTKTANNEAVDTEKAESIKCKYGISVIEGATEEGVRPQDIFAALRPSLEDLVSEMSRFLEYYKSDHEGKNIEVMAFYGGGAKMPGLSDYVSKNMGIPVILPNPVNLGPVIYTDKEKQELETLGSFLVNGIGSLLANDEAVNVIPQEHKESAELKIQRSKWIKMWIVLITGLVAIYVPLLLNGLLVRRNLSILKNKYEQLAPKRDELDNYNAKVSELNRKMTVCGDLYRSQPFWDDLMKELAAIIPSTVVINELSFAGEGGGAGLPFSMTGVAYVTGGRQEEGVTKFLQSLEKSKYFQKVKLEYSKGGKAGDEKILEFKIVCDIKKP